MNNIESLHAIMLEIDIKKTCDLHQSVCKKSHVTPDYIIMCGECKSAKFIFQHSSLSASVFTHTNRSTKFLKLKNGQSLGQHICIHFF